MPYSSNGNYALPPGYKAETGQKVLPTQHNPPLEDIASALSSVLLRDGRSPMTGNLPMGGNKVTDMAVGKASTDAATVGQLSASAPIGIIVDFAGTAAPSGWLLCHGQEISRAEFAALFAVIGTAYGAGNGSTTFNLPDTRGRVIAGLDNMGGTASGRLTSFSTTTVGGSGGAQTHVLTIAQMPSHDHGGSTGWAGEHSHPFTIFGQRYSDQGGSIPTLGGANTSQSWAGNTAAAGNHPHTISGQGGGEAHNIVQPTIVMNKIIRALAA